MTEITYPPLDVPKNVTESLWIVDSGLMKAMGVIPIPVRMTVIRLENGELLLHSPTQHTAKLQEMLEELGPIRHLVAPNIAHWTFMRDWQRHLPDVLTWAVPDLRDRGTVKRSGLRVDRDLGEEATPGWPGEIERIMVPGAAGFREIALFHQASRTLILADLVQNLEADKLPVAVRPFARIAGVLAPDGRAPAYLRIIVKLGKSAARDAGRRLVETRPERVIFGHGRWFN